MRGAPETAKPQTRVFALTRVEREAEVAQGWSSAAVTGVRMREMLRQRQLGLPLKSPGQ
jgi:hypothetical protein